MVGVTVTFNRLMFFDPNWILAVCLVLCMIVSFLSCCLYQILSADTSLCTSYQLTTATDVVCCSFYEFMLWRCRFLLIKISIFICCNDFTGILCGHEFPHVVMYPKPSNYYFLFKYDLEQKYYAPKFQPDRGSNLWPQDDDGTFQVAERPALNHLAISNSQFGLNMFYFTTHWQWMAMDVVLGLAKFIGLYGTSLRIYLLIHTSVLLDFSAQPVNLFANNDNLVDFFYVTFGH